MSSSLRPSPGPRSSLSSCSWRSSSSAPRCCPPRGPEDQKAKEKREKPAKITEEILVIGRSPKDVPLADRLDGRLDDIDKLKPRDISDVLKFIPGSMVTFGDKDTYTLKLRGIGANRIALLVDGVPVYEPYFGTFDLKTVSAGGIDTIQVTKGPRPSSTGRTRWAAWSTSSPSARRPSPACPSPGATATRTRRAWGSTAPTPGSGSPCRPAPCTRARTGSSIPSRTAASSSATTATSSASTSTPSSITRPRARPRSWSTAGSINPSTACPPPCSRSGPASGASPSGTVRPSTWAGSPRSAGTPSCASALSPSITSIRSTGSMIRP